jgi:hypothetical protein
MVLSEISLPTSVRSFFSASYGNARGLGRRLSGDELLAARAEDPADDRLRLRRRRVLVERALDALDLRVLEPLREVRRARDVGVQLLQRGARVRYADLRVLRDVLVERVVQLPRLRLEVVDELLEAALDRAPGRRCTRSRREGRGHVVDLVTEALGFLLRFLGERTGAARRFRKHALGCLRTAALGRLANGGRAGAGVFEGLDVLRDALPAGLPAAHQAARALGEQRGADGRNERTGDACRQLRARTAASFANDAGRAGARTAGDDLCGRSGREKLANLAHQCIAAARDELPGLDHASGTSHAARDVLGDPLVGVLRLRHAHRGEGLFQLRPVLGLRDARGTFDGARASVVNR